MGPGGPPALPPRSSPERPDGTPPENMLCYLLALDYTIRPPLDSQVWAPLGEPVPRLRGGGGGQPLAEGARGGRQGRRGVQVMREEGEGV